MYVVLTRHSGNGKKTGDRVRDCKVQEAEIFIRSRPITRIDGIRNEHAIGTSHVYGTVK